MRDRTISITLSEKELEELRAEYVDKKIFLKKDFGEFIRKKIKEKSKEREKRK